MLIHYEERRRVGAELYNVRSWYLFGFVLVFRQYEQLTVSSGLATPSERK
jgi:hypothetical protein